jgi:hypothetical protein
MNGETTERMRPHIPTAVRMIPMAATRPARICGSSHAPVSQKTIGISSAAFVRYRSRMKMAAPRPRMAIPTKRRSSHR